MFRHLTFFLLLFAGVAALATTVVINGKTVTVPVIKSDGKAYVDIVALMALLGGNANYNAAADKLVIATGGASAAGSSGTAEMAGDNGEFGKVYTLVQNNPLYFSLVKAEYTTTPVIIGDQNIVPQANEKLLVLHFTVQNPQKTELLARYDRLDFTAVDAMNVNHNAFNAWGDEENHQMVNMQLKPAQKLAVYAVVTVPAKGVVPKLIVKPGLNAPGPVLRYDLRDKVTGLAAPIADPADPTGATALETVPGVVGTTYPYSDFDVTVNGFNYTTDTTDGYDAPAGGRLLLVTLHVKDRSCRTAKIRKDYLIPVVTDGDGAELRYCDMIGATSDSHIDQEMKPGQEMTVRMLFEVPKGSTPAQITLKEYGTRTFQFAIQ